MLFPLLVFMVQFYGIAGDDPKAVGTYTGVLASMFPLAMFTSSFFWGWLSDHIGRKPVTLVGVFALGTGSILLGLTRDYYTALTIRIVSGLLNNITSMLKCMIAEMSGKHQAKGMSYFSVAFTTGTLMGPSLAGILAMPCTQYGPRFPGCSAQDSFLEKYPFFLSFFFFGAFTLISGAYAMYYTPETILKRKPLPRRLQFLSFLVPAEGKGPVGAREAVKYQVLEEEADEESQIHVDGVEMTEMKASSNGENGIGYLYTKDGQLELEASGAEGPHGDDDGAEGRAVLKEAGSLDEDQEKYDGWFRKKEVQIAVFLYFCIALFYVSFEELFPLFGSARVAAGGLSLASKDVGIFMSIGGGCTILYTLFLFPKMIKRGGTLWLIKAGSINCMILSVLTPLMRLLVNESDYPQETGMVNKSGLQYMSPLLWVVMVLHAIFTHVFGTNCFASVIMVVNKASPPQHFGAVNSYGQALASLARVVGPSAVGWLWTACGKIEGSMMLQVFLPFLFCGASAFAMFCLAFSAPSWLNSRS